jgi:Fe-Mn family superoxide dismutase
MKVSRRQAISGLVAAGSGLAFSSVAEAQTTAPAVARAWGGQHKPKPLPFDPAKLNGISEKLIKSHWENNYQGAVGALNVVEQRLAAMMADKAAPAYAYTGLKREELIRTGSVVMHEHYFANLGGNGKADGKAAELLKQWFGSYEQWEAEFKRTALGLSGGSGWVVLAHNWHTGEVHNYWAWDHSHNPAFSRPLLVLDMYEHAYQMDYGAAAAKYIDAFMLNVNWEEVNRRVESVAKLA